MLFFVIDITIGYVSPKRLKSSNAYFYGEINKAIRDTSKIFILGSSRAECHYNSKKLSSLYGKTVFNAGAGGYGIFYSYAVLKEHFKLHKPEIVVLDIEPTILNNSKQFDLLTKLQPLADIYTSFDEIVRINPDYKPFLMLFNSYKYNSTFYNIIKKTDNHDAFNPLKGTIDVYAKIAYHDPYEFSEEEQKIINDVYSKQLRYLDKIYNLCKQNSVKLYFVTSPVYVDYDKDNIIKLPLRKHFASKGYNLINFTNDKRFTRNATMFNDQMHLNAHGAEVFTNFFADTLTKTEESRLL